MRKMNLKIKRYNSTFEKEISQILQTEIKDESIRFVTITGCDISSDLSYCKVYFTILDDSKSKDMEESLNNASSFIRGELSKRVEIRHTPELKFIYDTSIRYGEHMEKRIQEVKEMDKQKSNDNK